MTETPAAAVVAPLDEFGQAALDRARGFIEALNAQVALVKAAQGDEQAVLDTLRKNPPNDEAARYNEAISDLLSKVYDLETARDNLLKPLVAQQMEQAKAGSEGASAQVDELRKKVKAATGYIKELYGEEHLASLPQISGMRAASSGSGGTGQRRVRGFDIWVDGVLATARNADGKEVSNLAAAAKVIGTSTEDLRNAFFSAQGTDDSKNFKPEVEFTFTVDGKNFSVVAKKVNEGEARATEVETAADAAAEASAE